MPKGRRLGRSGSVQPLLPNSPLRYVPGGNTGGMPNGAESGMSHDWGHTSWEKAPGKGAPCPKPQAHISNKQKMQVKKLPRTIVIKKKYKEPRNVLTKKRTRPFLWGENYKTSLRHYRWAKWRDLQYSQITCLISVKGPSLFKIEWLIEWMQFQPQFQLDFHGTW